MQSGATTLQQQLKLLRLIVNICCVTENLILLCGGILKTAIGGLVVLENVFYFVHPISVHWIKAASQYTSSLTSYISKCVDDVITEKSKISPKQKAWMKRWKVCLLYLEQERLPFGQMTTKHTTQPEQDWTLASRRHRGDISRDWIGQLRYVAGNSKCPPLCHVVRWP